MLRVPDRSLRGREGNLSYTVTGTGADWRDAVTEARELVEVTCRQHLALFPLGPVPLQLPAPASTSWCRFPWE